MALPRKTLSLRDLVHQEFVSWRNEGLGGTFLGK